jgi:ferric-dicitrate binding protein FerR (iron transport regulator)
MNLNTTQKELLNRWLNREADETDINAIKKDAELLAYIKISTATSQLQAPEFETEKAYVKLISKRNQPKVRKLFAYQNVFKYAAAITLVAGIYFLLQNKQNVIEVAYGQQTEVVLPDASEVRINAGSKLSFQKKNWNKNRLVQLKGEAYFKVSKGKKFTVKTPLGNVQVVGTQFNINQYDGLFEVECYEGKVDVSHNRQIVRLTPGKSVKLSPEGTLVISNIVREIPDWTTGVSDFEGSSLKDVLNELERQYNLKIDVEKDIDLEQKFTGSFNHDDLDLALKTICLPLKLSYHLTSDKKVTLHAQDKP